MSVKVAIDISPLKSSHAVRGVGSYTKNLVEALEQEGKRPACRRGRVKEQELKIDFIDFRDQQYNNLAIKQFDIVHYPFFDLFFLTLPLKKITKTIVTIHDVIPLVFPEHYPPGIKGKLKFQIQKFSLQGTSAVITDSENSKKDIVKYLSYPEEKIHVVYLAPGKEFKKLSREAGSCSAGEIRRKYNLPEKFVLYVGDVNWNKNIQGLIRAFAQLQQTTDNIGYSIGLVLVGKAFKDEGLEETKEILQLIKKLGLEERILRLGWVSEEDLVKIYNLAIVYCQPSFYEGFGLPVLEAMACGCPTVVAKTSSLPEICEEAAIMVNPENIDDIAKGLDKVIGDQKICDTIIKKGLDQAKKFSWEKTAKETINVYRKVAS